MALARYARRFVSFAAYGCGLIKLLQRFSKVPKIITYHRICLPPKDHFIEPGMYVTPQTFDLHCRYLAGHCRVIPVDELAEILRSDGKPPPASVSITFDDGWADNYQNAFPILHRHRLAATFFLATKYIGTQDTLWTDKCVYSVETIRMHKPRRQDRFAEAIDDPVLKTVEAALIAAPGLEVERALLTMINALKTADAAKRSRVVSMLEECADEFQPGRRPIEFLSWEEAEKMSDEGQIFGSHTHSHRPLSELNAGEIEAELKQSHSLLNEHQLKRSEVFCYPGGELVRTDTVCALH